MYIQSLAGNWLFRKTGDAGWLPARVPGGVHTDLLALGLIPDPFVADNEKRVMWVAESDWEYRQMFAADAALLAEERLFLVCDGLDTLAEVRLNGQAVGKTDNMFCQYRWDIKELLQEGENELLIAFASPVKYGLSKMEERPLAGVSQAIPGGPYLRKAPCHFGWDWGPMLPPMGVWKDIRLEGRSVARLEDIHLRQCHQEGRVTVSAQVAVEQWQERPLSIHMCVTAPDGAMFEADQDCMAVTIADPQLWWPNGYGEQPLYQVEVALLCDGRIIDLKSYQLGLRTLELRRQPDEWGESFTFVVNGVPIFAKGSNWIPADSFPTRISDAYLERLICSAAESHQNMLRVWGGGFYEEDRFYDLCDRYGILVWQDGVYSCSIYPLDDEAFVENLRIETEQNVKRLRHRASLALWCGNNEMEMGWESWGWAKQDYEDELLALAHKMPVLKQLLRMASQRKLLPDWKELRDAYDLFFHKTLPAWIARLDPDHPYWPSSPSSDTPFHNVNGQEQGDAHYWDVWHGRQPFTAYRDQFPRFMSEFGFQSLPPLKTVAAYAEPKDWNMTSYIMEHHQRSGSGNGLMIGQMTDTFRMPKDFPSLVYLSMILQAEGIRYGVEHWRRSKGPQGQRISGTLYWQLNDCWPVASWASLDYFARWKALHYAAKRFYAPVLLSIEDNRTAMSVHVTSDLVAPWQGVVCWSLETLDGLVLDKVEQKVSVAPLMDTHVCTLDLADCVNEDNCRQTIFIAELWQGETQVALQVATLAPPKHLELVEPGLKVNVRQEGSLLAFDLTACSLARFVELSLNGVDAVFSDNYFDLPAGRVITVTCPLPEGWTEEKARSALQARSLYDSFA